MSGEIAVWSGAFLGAFMGTLVSVVIVMWIVVRREQAEQRNEALHKRFEGLEQHLHRFCKTHQSFVISSGPDRASCRHLDLIWHYDPTMAILEECEIVTASVTQTAESMGY